MARLGDRRAGLTLLDDLRTKDDPTPCVLHTGSASPEQSAEVRHHGGLGETASPAELVGLVSAGLGDARAQVDTS